MNFDPQQYGTPVASYTGTGILTTADDKRIDCEFELLQLINGKIIVLGAASDPSMALSSNNPQITQLLGKTEDGYQLVGERFFVRSFKARWSVDSGWATDFRLLASKIEIRYLNSQPRFWRFKVLNAHFPATLNGISIGHPIGLATLRRTNDYDALVDRLRSDDFAITAEIEIEADSRQNAENIAEDVCYLLSIACGTKVQWIAYDECDAGRQALSIVHCNKVTKRHVSLSTIDYREPNDTEQFLVSTIATFVQRKREWELSKGLIDSYLDAKQDADYLETRALKLVAAVERFKRVFIQVTGYQEFAISQDIFQSIGPRLQERLSSTLTELGLDGEQRKVVYANLKGANRRSFGETLDAIHELLEIGGSIADRKLFVNCRNSLVHDGRFYCESASDQDRDRIPPCPGKTYEYCWILHFVDRLFLRLVGYEGPYLDWSEPGNPIRRQRMTVQSSPS